MKNNMQRYEVFFDADYDMPRLQPSEGGSYVRYEDAQIAIDNLWKELAIYKALVERISMQQADKEFAEALRNKPFKE